MRIRRQDGNRNRKRESGGVQYGPGHVEHALLTSIVVAGLAFT